MPFQLPELPYAKDALAPHMSAETLDFHWGKHHRAYVTKTNEPIERSADLSGASLVEIIRKARKWVTPSCSTTAPRCGTTASSGNASRRPQGQQPSGHLAELIAVRFRRRRADAAEASATRR